MVFHARSVEECWRLARRHTMLYQRRLNTAKSPAARMRCLAAVRAVDRLALDIRFGTRRKRTTRGGR